MCFRNLGSEQKISQLHTTQQSNDRNKQRVFYFCMLLLALKYTQLLYKTNCELNREFLIACKIFEKIFTQDVARRCRQPQKNHFREFGRGGSARYFTRILWLRKQTNKNFAVGIKRRICAKQIVTIYDNEMLKVIRYTLNTHHNKICQHVMHRTRPPQPWRSSFATDAITDKSSQNVFMDVLEGRRHI